MTKEKEQRIGYKVTDSSMTCRGFQFELNKTFTHKGRIGLCDSGFHFCRRPADCFNYYSFNTNNRVFEIHYGENVEHGDDKSVTDEIIFVREIPWEEVLTLVNTGKANTGIHNSGDRNSGDRNSGDRNSGHRNSGHRNSGHWNSGHSNSGDSNSGHSNSGHRNSGHRNSGDWNSGDWNSGNRNSGDRNSGDRNSGDRNSGDSNSGHWNSGDRNSGHWNSGDRNSGDRNSGHWNSGDRNSGDSNSGYRSAGAFCTDKNPVVWLFDRPTNIPVKEWEQMEVVSMMYSINLTIWTPEDLMTSEEKDKYPCYKTTAGYLRPIPIHEAWGNFWNNLTDEKKALFTNLPNFDAEKFKEITGISVK